MHVSISPRKARLFGHLRSSLAPLTPPAARRAPTPRLLVPATIVNSTLREGSPFQELLRPKG